MRIHKLIYGIFLLSFSVLAQTDPCPCCTENHRAFDFWVGEWEVFKPDGTLAGTNSIKKDQDNCILRENWISSNNLFTGSSVNFYNSQTTQWEQLWIDNAGSHLYLYGKRIGNQMVLVSDEIPREKKSAYVNRITYTLNEDGTVRQLWEILIKGEVTNVAFDGLYKKKE
ncbi:MAG: hypothetical protein ACR2MM_09480 [Flavobacteriaceae bacterium]